MTIHPAHDLEDLFLMDDLNELAESHLQRNRFDADEQATEE